MPEPCAEVLSAIDTFCATSSSVGPAVIARVGQIGSALFEQVADNFRRVQIAPSCFVCVEHTLNNCLFRELQRLPAFLAISFSFPDGGYALLRLEGNGFSWLNFFETKELMSSDDSVGDRVEKHVIPGYGVNRL